MGWARSWVCESGWMVLFAELGKTGGGRSWQSPSCQAQSLLRSLHEGSKERALRGMGEVLKLNSWSHAFIPWTAGTPHHNHRETRGVGLPTAALISGSGVVRVRCKSDGQDQSRGVMGSQWRSRTHSQAGAEGWLVQQGMHFLVQSFLCSPPGTSRVWLI